MKRAKFRQKIDDEIVERETGVAIQQIKQEVKTDEPSVKNINVCFSKFFFAHQYF